MGVSASETLPAGAKRSDPEPVPNTLEVREVSEQARGHGHVLGAKSKA